ncbi:hypothetical protein PoB_001258800 [Plakobranchus ocellatus]|uniref:Uncharacterized protein n=1 Tax=Plakobranchus ocellatus TaxID=259542 RepID=A0AAV3YUQ4_9GAST|nr:hypothetical protein PoB_001258800 [Plakobranchus ocellatus]
MHGNILCVSLPGRQWSSWINTMDIDNDDDDDDDDDDDYDDDDDDDDNNHHYHKNNNELSDCEEGGWRR